MSITILQKPMTKKILYFDSILNSNGETNKSIAWHHKSGNRREEATRKRGEEKRFSWFSLSFPPMIGKVSHSATHHTHFLSLTHTTWIFLQLAKTVPRGSIGIMLTKGCFFIVWKKPSLPSIQLHKAFFFFFFYGWEAACTTWTKKAFPYLPDLC